MGCAASVVLPRGYEMKRRATFFPVQDWGKGSGSFSILLRLPDLVVTADSVHVVIIAGGGFSFCAEQMNEIY